MEHIIDNVVVCVKNGTIPEEEAAAYVARGRERFGSDLKQIIATLDPDDPEMIDLEYITPPKKFHRLRRITGYLVGNLGRWNNAKRAEEGDRVKHGTEVSG